MTRANDAVYFKAIRPDGTSFWDRAFRWVPEDWDGATPVLVKHPAPYTRPGRGRNAGRYLSAASVATDCTGFSWPCKLLRVEPVGQVWTTDPALFPNKRAASAWTVVEELDPRLALGPNADDALALIDRASTLTHEEVVAARVAARDAAWGAAWVAARNAAWVAARGASWDVAWDAARDAASAEVVRDLIPDEHYRALRRAWVAMTGEGS